MITITTIFIPKLQIFLYKILTNKIALIIVNIIVSTIILLLIKDPVQPIYAMNAPGDGDDNNFLPRPYNRPLEKFIHSNKNRASAEELQQNVLVIVAQSENPQEEVARLTTVLNRVIARHYPKPDYVFGDNLHIQDIGRLPQDHPDAQINIEREPINYTRAFATMAAVTVLTAVTVYILYTQWGNVQEVILDITGFGFRRAVAGLNHQFDIIRHNPQAVEEVRDILLELYPQMHPLT